MDNLNEHIVTTFVLTQEQAISDLLKAYNLNGAVCVIVVHGDELDLDVLEGLLSDINNETGQYPNPREAAIDLAAADGLLILGFTFLDQAVAWARETMLMLDSECWGVRVFCYNNYVRQQQ
jgi:hypothetical protein